MAVASVRCAPLPEEPALRPTREVTEAPAPDALSARGASEAIEPARPESRQHVVVFALDRGTSLVRGALPEGYDGLTVTLLDPTRSVVNLTGSELPYVWRASATAGARYVVRYSSAAGLPTFTSSGEVRAAPAVAAGERCDPLEPVDRCAAGSACRVGRGASWCVPVTAPAVIEAVSWVSGASVRSIATFAPTSESFAIQWRREGEPSWRSDRMASDESRDGRRAALSLPVSDGDARGVEWRAVVSRRGASAIEGAPSLARIAGESPAREGSACVFSEPWDVCDPGLRCAASAQGVFRCAALPTRCSAGLPQFDEVPAPPAGGASTLAITPTTHTRDCFTSCNARATVSGAFRFVAPRDGTYAFKWAPTGGGEAGFVPQIALRYSCQTYDDEATESCLPTAGFDRGTGRRRMSAGEEILVVPFAGATAATLTVIAE